MRPRSARAAANQDQGFNECVQSACAEACATLAETRERSFLPRVRACKRAPRSACRLRQRCNRCDEMMLQ
eukprot:6186727-Pleurochrysis_carterae.AAC.1